jgi:myo-inositol-1(or 4)-monophosphatase
MTTVHLLSEWIDLAIQAAHQGGDILKKFWGNLREIKEKDFPGDLVTEADQLSEKAIIHSLSLHFPEHQILAEESGISEQKSDFIWVIDPLDGTTNYAHQYPMVAVSIGLLYQREPILGVVYNPFTQELFHAAKGLGAHLNHHPIKVSRIINLNESLLATGFAYDRREVTDNNYAEFSHFTQLTQGVRRAGAASLDLAYVACGRLDGYWERGLKP